MFVKSDKTYDFEKLRQVTRVVARNLNKIIDINYYPIEEVSDIRQLLSYSICLYCPCLLSGIS